MTVGMKFDSEKPMMSLLPPNAALAVGRVLTMGAKKYAPDNWRLVENGHQRYLDASLRHLFAYISGQKLDPESGENHMAHVICCAMFILDAAESGNPLK